MASATVVKAPSVASRASAARASVACASANTESTGAGPIGVLSITLVGLDALPLLGPLEGWVEATLTYSVPRAPVYPEVSTPLVLGAILAESSMVEEEVLGTEVGSMALGGAEVDGLAPGGVDALGVLKPESIVGVGVTSARV